LSITVDIALFTLSQMLFFCSARYPRNFFSPCVLLWWRVLFVGVPFRPFCQVCILCVSLGYFWVCFGWSIPSHYVSLFRSLGPPHNTEVHFCFPYPSLFLFSPLFPSFPEMTHHVFLISVASVTMSEDDDNVHSSDGDDINDNVDNNHDVDDRMKRNLIDDAKVVGGEKSVGAA
jgi:hypothetical protein